MKYPTINDGQDVAKSPGLWAWDCKLCPPRYHEQECAMSDWHSGRGHPRPACTCDFLKRATVTVGFGGDEAHPEFAERYERPALGAINFNAAKHIRERHRGY